MNDEDIYRAPQQLHDTYLAYRDPATRDIITYCLMWSWHDNWFPNGPADPFDTSPDPNDLFDPMR